jgi:hypothetical protein
MSNRMIVSLAASLVIGIAFIQNTSTDAFSEGKADAGRTGVHHGHVYHGIAHRVAPVHRGTVAGVTLGAGATATGVVYAPRCGYAPYPPCR